MSEMMVMDKMLNLLWGWCARRAAEDETAGLDSRTQAAIRASADRAA